MEKPSFKSSPWIRGAPHRVFSRDIRRTRWRISLDTGGRPGFLRRDFHVQKSLNPLRCQPMTVSGLTITRAWRQPGHRQDRMTQKTLSAFRSDGRGLFRFRTATCCRRARISVWSAARSAKISMILCMPERVSGGDAKFQGFCDRWNKWEGQAVEGPGSPSLKPEGSSRIWRGDEAARRAVTNNRTRLLSGVAKEAFQAARRDRRALLRPRTSIASGMRRTWLIDHGPRERASSDTCSTSAGHNLSLLMRQLYRQAGTPREAVAGGYGGIFVLLTAHRGHAGRTGGLAKRPDGFQAARHSSSDECRAGKSRLNQRAVDGQFFHGAGASVPTVASRDISYKVVLRVQHGSPLRLCETIGLPARLGF